MYGFGYPGMKDAKSLIKITVIEREVLKQVTKSCYLDGHIINKYLITNIFRGNTRLVESKIVEM